LLLYAPFTSTLNPNARDHRSHHSPMSGYPSNGSWFLVPVVYFLLSVSLFSASPRYHPLAIMIMRVTTRWTTRSLGLATCLNTLLARGLHRAPPTSSQKLALSRRRTSQPDTFSSAEGRPPRLSIRTSAFISLSQVYR
jgi:hypothetical protein